MRPSPELAVAVEVELAEEEVRLLARRRLHLVEVLWRLQLVAVRHPLPRRLQRQLQRAAA